jgi:hypothetical protein
MRRLRKEDLSLHRYIKDTVLRPYVELEELATLELMPDVSCEGSYVYRASTSQVCEPDSDIVPYPVDYGRGWVFFDCPELDEFGECVENVNDHYVLVSGTDALGTSCMGTPEQSNRVKIYDENLLEIVGVTCLVDYVDGCIVLDTPYVVPKYVNYYWNYVSVVDEWPSGDAPEPPVVVIAIDQTNKAGYQIGAGIHTRRQAKLHIFASSAAERADLKELLYDSLYNKCCPVYDFPTGDVLDADGTFYGRKITDNKLTSLFNRTSLNDLGLLHGGMTFHNVEARNVKTNLFLDGPQGAVQASLINAYRATVSFEIQTYTRS